MNSQEIYETVSKHLFAQGERAHEDYGCRYRTRDNKKCAVGCLIPDNVYSRHMEGNDALYIISHYEDLSFLEPYRDLLNELQMVHDTLQFWKSEQTLRKALRQVGSESGLSTEFLDELSFKSQ